MHSLKRTLNRFFLFFFPRILTVPYSLSVALLRQQGLEPVPWDPALTHTHVQK